MPTDSSTESGAPERLDESARLGRSADQLCLAAIDDLLAGLSIPGRSPAAAASQARDIARHLVRAAEALGAVAPLARTPGP